MTMFRHTASVNPHSTGTLRDKALVLATSVYRGADLYVTVVMRGKRATVTLWGEEEENFTLSKTGKLRLTREGKGWRFSQDGESK